jgi:hypothetical protein
VARKSYQDTLDAEAKALAERNAKERDKRKDRNLATSDNSQKFMLKPADLNKDQETRRTRAQQAAERQGIARRGGPSDKQLAAQQKARSAQFDQNRAVARQDFEKKSAQMSLENKQRQQQVFRSSDQAIAAQQARDARGGLDNAPWIDPSQPVRYPHERQQQSRQQPQPQRQGPRPSQGLEGEVVDGPKQQQRRQQMEPARRSGPKVIDGDVTSVKDVPLSELTPAEQARLREAQHRKGEVIRQETGALRAIQGGNGVDAAQFRRGANADKMILNGDERAIYQMSATGKPQLQVEAKATLNSIDQTQARASGLEEKQQDAYEALRTKYQSMGAQCPAGEKQRILAAERAKDRVKKELGGPAAAALESGSTDFSPDPVFQYAVDQRAMAVKYEGKPPMAVERSTGASLDQSVGRELGGPKFGSYA